MKALGVPTCGFNKPLSGAEEQRERVPLKENSEKRSKRWAFCRTHGKNQEYHPWM
jgi:hypothetical protein